MKIIITLGFVLVALLLSACNASPANTEDTEITIESESSVDTTDTGPSVELGSSTDTTDTETNNYEEEVYVELVGADYLLYIDPETLMELQNGFVYIGRPTCPFCVIFEPILRELVQETQTIVYYFNTDNFREHELFSDVIQRFDVPFVPFMVKIEDGEIITIFPGPEDADDDYWKQYFYTN